MCEPISITLGVLSAVGTGMQAIGAHQQQSAAVARSNAIAQQNYINELQIANRRDLEKGRVYEAELKADAAAKNAYYKQISANQAEASRALVAEQQKVNEQATAASFNVQKNVAQAIQAQGTVLARGGAGNSLLLQSMDAERQLGLELAQVEATLYDAGMASRISQEGILLDQAAANTAAWNNLPASPLTPSASFMPIKPIKQAGPSGLALAGSLVGSAVSGVSSGLSTYGSLKSSDLID
jgi:hypothetical protein